MELDTQSSKNVAEIVAPFLPLVIVLNLSFTQAIRSLTHLTKVTHMTSPKESQEEKQTGIRVVAFVTPIIFVCRVNACIMYIP